MTPPLDLATAARLPSGEVLRRLDVTPAGLTTQQAAERLRTVGPNVLAEHKVTVVGVLLRQLRSVIEPLLVHEGGPASLLGPLPSVQIV